MAARVGLFSLLPWIAGPNETMLRGHADRKRSSDVGRILTCAVPAKCIYRVTYGATPTTRIDQRDCLDKILVPCSPSSILPVTRLNALVLSPVRATLSEQ